MSVYQLEQTGLVAPFDAWANAPSRTFAERAFLCAPTWKRTNLIMVAVAADWGRSPAQIDDLFRLATTL